MRAVNFMSLAACLCVLGCQPESVNNPVSHGKAAGNDVTIEATAFPVFQIAEQLAGDAAKVRYAISNGVAAAEWIPNANDISRMQQADCILLHGHGYESWLAVTSLPRSRLLQTAADLPSDRLITVPAAMTHQHGPDGGSSVSAIVTQTWMDPELAAAQVTTIERKLIQLLPKHRNEISTRATVLRNELEIVDSMIKRLSASGRLTAANILIESPQMGYLVVRLGISKDDFSSRVTGVDFEESVSTLANKTEADQPLLFLHRSGFAADKIKWLKNLQIASVEIDLCETPADNATLIERLSANLERLSKAVGHQ